MSNQALIVSNPKELLTYLSASESAIKMALPKHLDSQRMLRLALTCFSTNEELRKCSAKSILSSLIVASQLGLEPGIAGQGYLIPYKGVCTFVPGWQGLVGLLNNSGRATAWTGAVYEGDTWEFELGSHPQCKHLPGLNYGNPEKLTWVYACGKVNGSEQPVVEAWPMRRIVYHRDTFNKVGERHYSFKNMEMYARKVVLLQVLKYMPRSIELNNAIVAADASEMGRATTVEAGIVIEAEPTDIPAELPPPAPPAPVERPLRGPRLAPASASMAAPVQNPETIRATAAELKQKSKPLPESEPEPEPTFADGAPEQPEPEWTLQGELRDFCTTNKFTFQNFHKWAVEAKWITPDMGKIEDWPQIPATIATRCLRSKAGLLAGMKRIAEGGNL